MNYRPLKNFVNKNHFMFFSKVLKSSNVIRVPTHLMEAVASPKKSWCTTLFTPIFLLSSSPAQHQLGLPDIPLVGALLTPTSSAVDSSTVSEKNKVPFVKSKKISTYQTLGASRTSTGACCSKVEELQSEMQSHDHSLLPRTPIFVAGA